MWVLGFLARMPPASLPSPVLLAAFATTLALGGAVAGRLPGGGAGGGAGVGLVASLVNLLLLGSLLSGSAPNSIRPNAAYWIPGFLAAGALIGALGGALGQRSRKTATSSAREPDWTALLAKIAAAATVALLAVGGLVTSHDAGLAVVDWPNSYGYNLFLYPLSRMVGGIFYEHAHRLFGSFVGLCTAALFIRLIIAEPRKWVRAAGAIALALVVFQGILGGLRVTGRFTTSVSPDVVQPNNTLAMVHGVVGQLFFATMVALAAFTSRTWKEARPERVDGTDASSDRTLTLVFLLALFLQLLLGVSVRHAGRGTMLHIAFSAVVVLFAVLVGVRLLVHVPRVPAMRPAGLAILILVGVQFLLGIAAFIALGPGQLLEAKPGSALATPSGFAASSPPPGPPGFGATLFPTLHQTNGALLLGAATIAFLWVRRLLPARPTS